MLRRSHQQHRLLQLYITTQSAGVRNSSSSSSSSSNSRAKPAISQKVKFVDQLRVVAKGGNGGGGASALFGRTGHHPRAAGGNGAPGGTVILRASKQLSGLGSIPLHIEAARGGNGGKQWMEGKRGAEKIVDVPLGTLVYQLLQLRGDAGSPYGVTAAQPDTAAASSLGVRQQDRQQQQQCIQKLISNAGADAAADVASQQQGPQSNTGSSSIGTGISISSSSSSRSRRKLFPQFNQLQSAAGAPAQQVQCTTSSSSSSSDDNSSSKVESLSKEQQHAHSGEMRTAAATAASAADKLSTSDSDEHETAALYEQLVTCQRQLTNAEKLSLLNTGRLPAPNCGPYELGGPDSHAAAAARGMLNSGDLSEDDSDVFSGTENERASAEDDDWIVLPPAEGDTTLAAAAGGDGDGDGLERQFSKKQVWSILESQAVLLGELTQDGQTLPVATGGKGGRGNAVSASKPHGPASRARTGGLPGQEVMLLLQLKLLADVVLVGLPNVGKSSLIAALTHARAQVGSYAFTTLRPQLGTLTAADPQVTGASSTGSDQPISLVPAVVQSSAVAAAEAAAAEAVGPAGTSSNSEGTSSCGPSSSKLVLADLPGLVPGAHAGKGRGTAFLAHLQRARCLALVIDMTGGANQVQQQGLPGGSCVQGDSDAVEVEGWQGLVPYTPSEQLAILQEELQQFDASVLQLPIIVVANKVDVMLPEAATAALESLKMTTTLPIVPVSAKQGLGLQRLKSALQLLVGSSIRHSTG